MLALATCPNTPNKETSSTEGEKEGLLGGPGTLQKRQSKQFFSLSSRYRYDFRPK
jgi:hypothetical protein